MSNNYKDNSGCEGIMAFFFLLFFLAVLVFDYNNVQAKREQERANAVMLRPLPPPTLELHIDTAKLNAAQQKRVAAGLPKNVWK